MVKNTVEKFVIKPMGNFPNNSDLPFLHYSQVFNVEHKNATEVIKATFLENQWYRPWVDSIFTYNHYHSNNHEVLGIAHGTVVVLIGGDEGRVFELSQGDAIVIPAGVSHKRLESSKDFKCVGAYSIDNDYNMKYGYPSELEASINQISQLPLPGTDPIFGTNGPLLKLWRS